MVLDKLKILSIYNFYHIIFFFNFVAGKQFLGPRIWMEAIKALFRVSMEVFGRIFCCIFFIQFLSRANYILSFILGSYYCTSKNLYWDLYNFKSEPNNLIYPNIISCIDSVVLRARSS